MLLQGIRSPGHAEQAGCGLEDELAPILPEAGWRTSVVSVYAEAIRWLTTGGFGLRYGYIWYMSPSLRRRSLL